ncbi:Inner membrane metabolite transport protein YgcS [Pseudomonas fluorescens]|uniref:Inner membrane metabolite transport protein YgcS n=1 Tax=Pseudomonas fluorescens TaxID=294 RepID=A0A5E6SAY1_PSEFL|nr:MFS transporter [Pseudomonas fluorescens]VVM77312.1 Inner membrane metabolite transport protein YgcS [Pseudomonas fluorescens]
MSVFDVIENSPVSKFHRKLLLACCGGPFLDGYILSLIGIALVGFSQDISATTLETGLIGAASLLGIFFGATVFGALTDRIGRETMYALDLAVLVIACGLSAFVTDAWQLIALRFVIGLAVGADYPIATSLLTEFTPAKRRGFMIGVSGLAWSIGAMTAFLVGYLMVQYSGDHSLWRWMLFSGAVLGIIVVIARRGIPESPRWLASKGRVREAEEVIKLVYGKTVSITDQDILELNDGAHQRSIISDLRLLCTGGYLKRTIMCGVLYFAQITPQYVLYTFGGLILLSAGIQEDNSSTLGELLIAMLFALGILPALRLVETWGRRPMAVVPFALMALPLIALGLWADAPDWFIVAAFAFYAFVSGGPSILEWIYPNELFPTAVRATAVGVAVGFSRIGAATGTYLMPIGIATIGLQATILIGAGITLVAFVICLAWAPETRGRSLHQTASLSAYT